MKFQHITSSLKLTLSVLFVFGLLINSYQTSIVKAATNHVVISEIKIAGETATDEFIELYNPTNAPVNMEGWRLTRKTASGSESNLVSSITGTIPAQGYYLVAHLNFTGTSDETYSAGSNSISANNTILLYSDAGETIVDKVGMGEASDVESLTTIVPDSGSSIERKANSSSDQTSMSAGGTDETSGNGEDTDNNNSDFITRSESDPQSSTSPTETPSDTPTNEPSVTTNPSVTTTPTINPDEPTIVISEIMFAGNTTGDEFVELYNPTNTQVDLTDWRLRKKTATGTSQSNLVSSITGSIPSHGYFLIAPSEYEGTTPSDQEFSTSTRLTANNTVYLYKPTTEDYELVDKVGTGESDDSETTTTTSPEAGASIERKAMVTSTSDSMASGGSDETNGNGYDSDNNANDFLTRSTPQPQNTSSDTETLAGQEPTGTPSPTQSPSPTSTPSPISEPTLVPSPTDIPTPTPTVEPNKPQGYTVAWFPISGITCQVEYHPVSFGNWFTIYIPRINCSH